MPYCGDTSLVKHFGETRTVQLIRCRSWTCKDCVESRSRQLIAEAHGGKPNTFLTLTARVKPGDDMIQRAKDLSHAWRKLRLRAIRHYKLKHLPFIAVFEATKAGAPHLHILLRSQWLDAAWLSANMDDLTGSPIVKIKRIDNAGRVSGYIAKYCGKAPNQFGTCKRYWKSKDYEQRPERQTPKEKKPKGHGDRILEPWTRIVSNWLTFGWRVNVERAGFARAFITPFNSS